MHSGQEVASLEGTGAKCMTLVVSRAGIAIAGTTEGALEYVNSSGKTCSHLHCGTTFIGPSCLRGLVPRLWDLSPLPGRANQDGGRFQIHVHLLCTLETLKDSPAHVYALCASPDGTLCAAAYSDNTIS
jgi:hypothetical protein